MTGCLSCSPQAGESTLLTRLSAIRHAFGAYRTFAGQIVADDAPFCVARPRDEQSPPQVLTRREFDDLTKHAMWLSQMYMLQALPEPVDIICGAFLKPDPHVQALHDLVQGRVHASSSGAVTVRAALLGCAAVVPSPRMWPGHTCTHAYVCVAAVARVVLSRRLP